MRCEGGVDHGSFSFGQEGRGQVVAQQVFAKFDGWFAGAGGFGGGIGAGEDEGSKKKSAAGFDGDIDGSLAVGSGPVDVEAPKTGAQNGVVIVGCGEIPSARFGCEGDLKGLGHGGVVAGKKIGGKRVDVDAFGFHETKKWVNEPRSKLGAGDVLVGARSSEGKFRSLIGSGLDGGGGQRESAEASALKQKRSQGCACLVGGLAAEGLANVSEGVGGGLGDGPKAEKGDLGGLLGWQGSGELLAELFGESVAPLRKRRASRNGSADVLMGCVGGVARGGFAGSVAG
jgi:hypothetical protein